MATEIVHIYLPVSTEWIRALSIPRQDIERLTFRPLKWLRFATFTVCGAKGDFSATPGGKIVDYENVSFVDLWDKYYYTPEAGYHLVDYHTFDDRITSSAATQRRSTFREDICRRDESCVITLTGSESCDAAHVIPHSKGSEYITYVFRDRASLYEHLPFSLDDIVDINCVENGILLRKDLHQLLGTANIGFLKTPNFAMTPADVPRIEQGPIPHNCTTLQHLVPPKGRHPVPQWDVQADWSSDEVSAPPNILLDFMYGAAVVKYWKCDHLCHLLEKRFEDDFSKVLAEIPKGSASEDDESGAEQDDSEDPDWGSPIRRTRRKDKQKGRKTFSSDALAGLSEAMDTVLLLSMLLKGATPQSMAAEREKRNKEKEVHCQEQSSEKVRQWLNLDASTGPL